LTSSAGGAAFSYLAIIACATAEAVEIGP